MPFFNFQMEEALSDSMRRESGKQMWISKDKLLNSSNKEREKERERGKIYQRNISVYWNFVLRRYLLQTYQRHTKSTDSQSHFRYQAYQSCVKSTV